MHQENSLQLTIFDNLTDGICISSPPEEAILYLNPAAERMLDVTLDQVKGGSLCELLCAHLSTPGAADCASTCPLRKSSDGRSAVTFQGHYGPKLAVKLKDFSIERIEKWRDLRVRCLTVATPWLDSSMSEKHLTIIEDISAQMELERHREDWRSMIAHDLRTPITSVYGALRMLQEPSLGPQGGDARYIDLGLRNCDRMLELLDLYLDVSKLDAGLMPVKIAEIALLPAVRKCIEDQAPLAQERRIRVAMDVPAELEADADADLLERVLQNLLNNAVKYTPEGGRVDVRGRRGETGAVSVSITDDGRGISPDELPHLFDRYHQAKARREGRIKGTGLGLAFCREAVKVMKGDITVASELGKGSSFTVYLPGPAVASPAKRGGRRRH